MFPSGNVFQAQAHEVADPRALTTLQLLAWTAALETNIAVIFTTPCESVRVLGAHLVCSLVVGVGDAEAWLMRGVQMKLAISLSN